MKKKWKFILSNLDTLIAIFLCIFVAIYGVISGNQILFSLIAAVLGIIAFSLIRDRTAKDNLLHTVVSLEKLVRELISGKAKSEKFFVNRNQLPSLSITMKKSKHTLDMMGTSLLSVGITYQATLRELIESGVKIRLLVSNPDNSTLQEYLSKRYLEAETAIVHANQVRTSLTNLAQFVFSVDKGDAIQIRITDHVQTISYIGNDVEKPTGRIQVEFYLNKTGLERDPIFFLDSTQDIHWYNEFKNQFEFLWNDAEGIDPQKYLA